MDSTKETGLTLYKHERMIDVAFEVHRSIPDGDGVRREGWWWRVTGVRPYIITSDALHIKLTELPKWRVIIVKEKEDE